MKYCVVLISIVLAGCVNDRQLGDREFELDNFKKALEHYDRDISSGSKDPEVFAQAARASVQLGSFGTAERYYGKAVSNGAGIDVVRELAKFYVRTSNYGSAIRVYKYLLKVEQNKQPIYNNLGTAFLYSGSPFDAESYLLIAQQMDPNDPFPYLNLGLLYDQNLKKTPKAIGFYNCFMKLAPTHEAAPRVRQRLGEIERLSKEVEEVDCSVPYKEPARAVVRPNELKSRMVDLDGSDDSEMPPPIIPAEGKPAKKVEIVNLKSKLAIEIEDPELRMKPAVELYMKHKFAGAVKEFEKLPLKSFDANTALAFGDSLSRLFRFSDASTWLQLSEKIQSQPKTVELLISAFGNLGKQTEVKFWCGKYEGRPAYKTALRYCPISVEEKLEKPVEKKIEPETKKTILESSSK